MKAFRPLEGPFRGRVLAPSRKYGQPRAPKGPTRDAAARPTMQCPSSSTPSTVARSAEVDAPAADAAAPAAADAPEITKLDIRVGKILSIEVHPDADG